MHIIVDRDIPQATSAFSRFGDVTLVDGRSVTRAQLLDADILLVRSVTRVDAQLLEGTNVRLVGTATSGIDHLDTSYLDQRAIAYFDAAGCNARAVAEYVLACSFVHGRLAFGGADALQAGIIGYGHVGKIVCTLLEALGVHCIVNDPVIADASSDERFVEIDEALASDIVTLHVPLTETGDFPTRGLIGRKQLSRIRPEALLINTARGAVIDEEALIAWLADGAQTTVAIDCWAGEPTVDLALLRLVTIATPHIAGYTSEARLRATTILSRTLAAKIGAVEEWCPYREDVIALRTKQKRPTDPGEVLSAAVLECCDPRLATTAMRQMLGLPQRRRGIIFDQIRRRAATRHEFGSYCVASADLQADTVVRLREIGFETTTIMS